jgi:hypothetical protein
MGWTRYGFRVVGRFKGREFDGYIFRCEHGVVAWTGELVLAWHYKYAVMAYTYGNEMRYKEYPRRL